MRFQLSTSISICINMCMIHKHYSSTWNFLQQHIESYVVTLCSSVLHIHPIQRMGLQCLLLLFCIRFKKRRKKCNIFIIHVEPRFKYGPNCIIHFQRVDFHSRERVNSFSFSVKFYCYHIVIIQILNLCESDPMAMCQQEGVSNFENDIFITSTIWLSRNKFIAPKIVWRSNFCAWVFWRWK